MATLGLPVTPLPPLPWSDWWIALSVLVIGLSLAYAPYLVQARDGGLPVPGVRVVGLAMAIVALVIVADGLMGIPQRFASTARLLVPPLGTTVAVAVGSNEAVLFQAFAVGAVSLAVLFGARAAGPRSSVFLLAATVLSFMNGAAFLLLQPDTVAPVLVPQPARPVIGGAFAGAGVALGLVVAGWMPPRLAVPARLAAAAVWSVGAVVMVLAGYVLAGEGAVVMALVLAVSAVAPPVPRQRSVSETVVLGMVFAGVIPLVTVCSLLTMAWQIAEERETEGLHDLLAARGAREVGVAVGHAVELVEVLRWRDDVVEAVQPWDERRLVRILASTLQSSDALEGLAVLGPDHRVRARYGSTGLQSGEAFPDSTLVEAALETPRALTALTPASSSQDGETAVVIVALRQPDGAPAALLLGYLPTEKLAEGAGAARLGETGLVLLVDRAHGRILAHPDRALVGATLDGVPVKAGAPAPVSSLLGLDPARRVGPWLVTCQAVPGVTWEIAVIQDIREALGPVNRLGAAALITTLLFAGVLGAAGLVVGRRLARPVDRLEALAFQDPLTGLASRYFFLTWLAQALEMARRYQQPLSLIFLDLDHFKQVNDRYGHLTGDRVLQEVASRLCRGLRSSDLVVRYGGEEIVVALPQTAKGAALVVAEDLRQIVAGSPVMRDAAGMPVGITMSAGVATMPDDASDVRGLLEQTDAALYRAKAGGRNQVVPA